MRLSLTGLERLFNEKAKKNLLQKLSKKNKKKKLLFHREFFLQKTFFQQLKALN